jgi:DnaJ-class molecular chaperone
MNPDTEKPIRYVTCPECEGHRHVMTTAADVRPGVMGPGYKRCPTCEGYGQIEESEAAAFDRNEAGRNSNNAKY